MRKYFVFALLCACAEPTPYVAAPLPGDEGYRVVHKGGDKFVVIFHGNRETDMNDMRDFCYRRAAEITVANGGKVFEVGKKEEKNDDGPTFLLYIQIDLGDDDENYGEEVDAASWLKKTTICDENDWRIKNNLATCPTPAKTN